MIKFSRFIFYVGLLLSLCCSSPNSSNFNITETVNRVTKNYEILIQQCESNLGQKQYLPRTVKSDGSIGFINAHDWTSGFFPGSLWYIYRLTNDEKWVHHAMDYTLRMDSVKFYTGNHDIGFMIGSSFGNARIVKPDAAFDSVIVQAAKSLVTRFRPVAGVIQSWNKSQKWDCPVIIDNMMNLELLFLASKISGDSSYAQVAIEHADQTNKNHFRPDGSSYHVLNYDVESGLVTAKNTHQGLNDASAWARGQAWGLYGFTVAYRETKNEKYLDRAQEIAHFIMNHPNLPQDKIPYWDHDVDANDGTPRDGSAAAITASALLELKQFVSPQSHDLYLSWAKSIMASLSSAEYLGDAEITQGFLLKHCVGSFPHNSEIDVPLNYADYYFLEALYRLKQLQ
jgi:rhamnogalacturonyl hydrolase YesR